MKELQNKIRDAVQHAAGENTLSEEVLQEIVAGVAADMKERFTQAGKVWPLGSSDIPERPASEPD